MAERSSSSRRRSGDSQPDDSVGEYRYSDEVRTAFIDGLTFRSKPVQYAVIDGMAVVEGDILLGPVDLVEQRTEMRRAELAGAPVASGVVISGSQYRWPNCQVPYQIDATLPNQQRVTDAIAHWEARTNFRFVLRTPANEAQFPDYAEFIPGGGCSSYVGRQGGRQTVTLGDGCSTGNCIHEIGHVVGLWHEQSREDRDAFVTIQWANIIPSAVNNFAQHITDGDDVGAYDYGSIMHYPRDAFSANGQDTIVPTDPNAQIGQRVALSAGDISAASGLCQKAFPKDLPKEFVKEPPKDPPKEIFKDPPKELPKDPAKEFVKEPPKDFPKDLPKDPPKEPPKDFPKDPPKEFSKDSLKGELPKELPKDFPFDPPKGIREPPKGVLEPPKGVFEPPKGPFEPPKGVLEPPKGVFEPPKGVLDPPKGALEPPGPVFPGPFGVPFVLATGAEAAAGGYAGGYGGGYGGAGTNQVLAEYRQLLAQYAQFAAQGLLGPADLAAWQQHAVAAQQLARSLGLV